MKTHHIKFHLIALCLTALALNITAQDNDTFSIMTLNVDGQPAKYFSFHVNQDGPLSEGSERKSGHAFSEPTNTMNGLEASGRSIKTSTGYTYRTSDSLAMASTVSGKKKSSQQHTNASHTSGISESSAMSSTNSSQKAFGGMN